MFWPCASLSNQIYPAHEGFPNRTLPAHGSCCEKILKHVAQNAQLKCEGVEYSQLSFNLQLSLYVAVKITEKYIHIRRTLLQKWYFWKHLEISASFVEYEDKRYKYVMTLVTFVSLRTFFGILNTAAKSLHLSSLKLKSALIKRLKMLL